MTKKKSLSNQYIGIFKTTFLFGFVQVFKTLLGVIINKVAAVMLGAEGIGMIGIFNSTIGFIQTGAGLGVSQSAVRDISEAYGSNDKARFSKIIIVTKKIVLYTGLLGGFLTIVFSPWLSLWTMGDKSYTIAFIALSLMACFNVMTEGQLSILKGMRRMRHLANATMIGSVVGLVSAIPLFYFFGKEGIVPQMIIASVLAWFLANLFVKNIDYNRSIIPIKDVFKEAGPMIKMGSAMMLVAFLTSIVTLIIMSYIRTKGGLTDVGFYNAGKIILQSYFGVLITALLTDYYPRIAAVNKDNKRLQEELNKQLSVTLVLSIPLIVIFLFLMPYVVQILFTKEFYPTLDFLKYGIYGTIITLFSNQLDLILVAKFKIIYFTVITITLKIIQVGLSILLYNSFGLVGLGIMVTIVGLIHLLLMSTIVYKLYKITFTRFFLKLTLVFILFVIGATIASNLSNEIMKYSLGSLLTIGSVGFSIIISRKYFEIDLISIISNKFKK